MMCSPREISVVDKISSMMATRILASKPRWFILEETEETEDTDLDTTYYGKMNASKNYCFGHKNADTECDMQYDDGGHTEWEEGLNCSMRIIPGSYCFLCEGSYYIPFRECVTFSSSSYSYYAGEHDIYYIYENSPLTVELFRNNNIPPENDNLNEDSYIRDLLSECCDDLFADRRMYVRVYDLFFIAIFNPLLLEGRTYVCRPASFRNLGGDRFTTRPFVIREGSNPFEVAMKEAAKTTETSEDEIYFVHKESPIVLYRSTNESDSD